METNKHAWWKLVSLLAVALVPLSRAGASEPQLPHNPGELRMPLERIMREERVPGLGIVVVSNGTLAWQAGLGLANVAAKVPVDEKTLFRAGDISMSLVALAALQLQEQGKLRITDTLAQWAPEMAFDNAWEATDPVRLVHLLEHTSGLADMSLMEYAHDTSAVVSLKEALELNRKERKARWRPGSRAAYSSVGPALVAYVIEKVTGQPFEDYVTQHLFLPMGMKSATYFEPRAGFAGQYAADGVTALPYWNDLYRPSGALNASTQDMGQYLLMLLNRGSVGGVRIVTPASVERLEQPQTLAMVSLGVTLAPGLGMLNTIEHGVHFRGHYGIVNGGLAEIMYIPETHSGFVVMMNTLNPVARARILELLMTYLVQGMPPPEASAGATVDAELARRYEGYYIEDSPSLERLRFVDNLTSLRYVRFTDKGMIERNVVFGATQRWIAQTGRTFRVEGAPEAMIAVFRGQDGEMLMQSKWGTLRKVSTLQALTPLVIAVASILLMLSALFVGLVWAVRRLIKRTRRAEVLSVRLLPILASVLFFAICVIWARNMSLESLWGPWGRPTLTSIAALLFGIAFLVLSVASVMNVFRYRHLQMSRVAYWHSALVSMACLVIAVYLAYWKAIGVPPWWL